MTDETAAEDSAESFSSTPPTAITAPGYPRIRIDHVTAYYPKAAIVDLVESRELNFEEFLRRASFPEEFDSIRYRALVDINVMPEAALPAGKVDFRQQYTNYRERMYGGEASEYTALVGHMADALEQKIGSATPDAFVAIPSRKEPHTSRAANAALADLNDSGKNGFALVLHNDSDEPTAETLDDLALIRDQPDCLVVDLRFLPENGIGDARALMADALMEVCHRRESYPPMIMADADMTHVLPGTYAKLIDTLAANPEQYGATAWFQLDLETSQEDQEFSFKTAVSSLCTEVQMRDEADLTGSASAINLRWLPVIGGIPRLNLGEDKTLGSIMRNAKHHGMIYLRKRDACVFVSADRAQASYREGAEHYSDWEQGARTPRPHVGSYPLDRGKALHVLNTHYQNALGALSNDVQFNRLPPDAVSNFTARMLAVCEHFGLKVELNEGQFVLSEDL